MNIVKSSGSKKKRGPTFNYARGRVFVTEAVRLFEKKKKNPAIKSTVSVKAIRARACKHKKKKKIIKIVIIRRIV